MAQVPTGARGGRLFADREQRNVHALDDSMRRRQSRDRADLGEKDISTHKRMHTDWRARTRNVLQRWETYRT